MMDKSTSSLERLLGVLDLFKEEQLTWTPENIALALEVSIPTAYRYVKLLVDSGLLQKNPHQEYSLGSRIIALDHLLRTGDVMLERCQKPMQELAEKTGFDCVLSRLYGDQIIDTHRHFSSQPSMLGYGRGRARPLFLGAAPKVILASMGTTQLQRIFADHLPAAKKAGLSTEWREFKKYFSPIRKKGYYHSVGELEANLSAIACPLHDAHFVMLGAISLVSANDRMEMVHIDKLATHLKRVAAEINENLN